MRWIKNNQFVALLVGVLITCSTMFSFTIINDEESYNELFITNGDTLWTLAEQYRGNTPKQTWISEVMLANRLENQLIQAGETLLIPTSLNQYEPDHGVEVAGNTNDDK